MSPGLNRYLRTIGYLARNVSRGSGVFPFYASFKVTSRCASRCAHCYLPREQAAADLGTASAKRVIENIASSSVLVLVFEGGEPLLRDDIGDLLAFANSFRLFVSVVTSYPDGAADRRAAASPFVDFLQISIDEGHGNLRLFDRLGEIAALWRTRICVQTIVTVDTLTAMEEKALKARRVGCKILFIPLSPLYPDLADRCPAPAPFVEAVRRLKGRYPGTVVASSRYLDAYRTGRECSSASIVVDSDGGLFYPCHVRGEKPFNLLEGRLDDFVLSAEAERMREAMNGCARSCGWYQYFAISMRSLRDLPRDVAAAVERIR